MGYTIVCTYRKEPRSIEKVCRMNNDLPCICQVLDDDHDDTQQLITQDERSNKDHADRNQEHDSCDDSNGLEHELELLSKS
jgi:hypothetical protein